MMGVLPGGSSLGDSIPDGLPRAEAQAGRKRVWAIVQFILGLAQMAGAVVSLIFLMLTGINAWSLAAVMLTSICTTVSVLLFGSWRKDASSR
jgi:hypothetical protein